MNDWRKELADEYARYERVETACALHGLSDLPLMAWGNGVSWIEYGSDHSNSLQRFKEMVATIAIRLGPPETIGESTSEWKDMPDLLATWNLKVTTPRWLGDTVPFHVSVNNPKGCRIDPRQPRIKGQAPTLHPECKGVLDALEASL